MRPFCIATIGSILGITMGLYLKSIAHFFIFTIIAIFVFIMSYIISKKYMKIVSIILISTLAFSIYTFCIDKNYQDINKEYSEKEIEIRAIVISDSIEKEYKDVYNIKVTEIKKQGQNKKQNFKMILNVKNKTKQKLQYGDEISFKTIYEEPSKARNDGGFDYQKYLKTKKIVGISNAVQDEIRVIENDKITIVSRIIHDIKVEMIKKINETLHKDEANLCTGLLLGEKKELSENVQQDFRDSNLSHMLAISGAHVSYILLTITVLIEKLKIHKRWGKVVLIIFLLFFMALVGFTPSVSRACIMAILQLLANILFRKADTYQDLAISGLIILVFNPYALFDIGFELSFGGTIGIVLFSKKLFNNNCKNKILEKVKQMCVVTLSANIIIIPIMMYHFNTISFTFLISNLLAAPILGITLILSIAFLIMLFILQPIAIFISFILQPMLQLLMYIAKFMGNLPFSQVLVQTPAVWQIIIYYLILYLILLKRQKINYQKVIILLLVVLIISPNIFKNFPTNQLEINFIDVGQGDCMLVKTPCNKVILIDGGGSDIGSFDVGEKTLLPYLLDKGIMKIDYMIFSHFDSDHCKRIIYDNGEIKCKKCNNN